MDIAKLAVDASGVNILENYMLHVLDLRANYWSLWTDCHAGALQPGISARI